MRDVLGPGTVLGYCTNVHAGATWEQIETNVRTYAARVRRIACPETRLGLGMWLPYLPPKYPMPFALLVSMWRIMTGSDKRELERFRAFLEAEGIEPFTCNVFPFRDFHESVVKHRVYEPDWTDSYRMMHTFSMAGLMHTLHPGGRSCSMSTLPIGWPSDSGDDQHRLACSGAQLRKLAELLQSGNDHDDPRSTVDLEPEPGCILDTCDDVIAFFSEHLPDKVHRRHIGVCHDVCHAAVMFEDQEEVLRRYAEAGIRVNKVQISSCPRVPTGDTAALDVLRRFVEPRYLHQTMVRGGGGQTFFEDLPDALAALDSQPELAAGEWRTHFHVPVYMDRIGALETTRDQIIPAIKAARKYHDCKAFEVETYAWTVLPDEGWNAAWDGDAPEKTKQEEWLSEGIARELLWVREQCEAHGISEIEPCV